MTVSWKRLAGIVIVAVVVPTLASAAPPREPTRDETFTETTEVTAVEVPVQVVLDGKPVRGLTAENFTVFQDKKKEPVTGFETVDLYTIPEDKAAEVPAPARRHFLLLFDLSFSEPKSVL